MARGSSRSKGLSTVRAYVIRILENYMERNMQTAMKTEVVCQWLNVVNKVLKARIMFGGGTLCLHLLRGYCGYEYHAFSLQSFRF